MAKQSGLGDNFLLAGYDLSGDVASLDQISSPLALLDVTPINKSAVQRIGGIRDGDMQFSAFFSTTGTASAPGFPTTGTPVVSTFNFPVRVLISGGTVSSVTVNGVSQGTGGSYLLPEKGTITVAFTGSPTWTWTTQGGEHTILSTLPRTDVIASYFRGTALQAPAACVNGKQINYDWTRDTSGNLSLKAEVQANSFGLEWGELLTPGLRTDTAATTGSAITDAAGTAFGGQAYFQLIEFQGTSVTLDIQSATTSGGTYATTGLTSSAFTTLGAQRVAVANTTTINQFLKVVSTGTFTSAVLAVVLVRNPVAGIVF